MVDGADIAWRAKLGIGFATVSVADGRVYAMGYQKGQDVVHCFDAASGETLWTDAYDAELYDKLHEGGPGATPTVDGKRVYTLSKGGKLRCYDARDGELRWAKKLPELLDVDVPNWGFSGSPLVEGKKLIVSAGPVVALNKQTGAVLWRSKDFKAGYSSPNAFTVDGKRRVAVFNAYGPVVVDAKDGSVVAKHRWETEFDVNASTPIVLGRNNRHIFISSNAGAARFKLSDGTLEPVWQTKKMRNHFNSCVVSGRFLYGFDGKAGSGKGKLKCLDARTGRVQWAHKGLGTGSLMAADGKLVILSEHGRLVIAEAGADGYQLIAQAQVLGGKCWTMPVLANGRIYCRNNDRGELVAVDVR